ncbi:LacI family DNA-binding transcriptional regulator [Variovorax rhizosphaerae]|uniref:LacI family DNA-binding transcriptional regulator n=1 Tax=Variovorax rhizosphaerae TaxID=1836200 RepID=A0ABU8WMX8_9BURK
MATIKDVARQAGVSVTTVSHVVNKTRFVSDKGRARVEQAIRELGYVPSAVARSLQRSATATLGMLIPNSSNPYFAEIVRGIEDRCFGAGYNLILCNTDDEPLRQCKVLQVLAERRVDGLIVVSSGEDPALPGMLSGLRVPAVMVDREIDTLPCDLVETAHMHGALLAVQHLTTLGHRRIACISGPAGVVTADQRVEGWRMALAGLGVPSAGLLFAGDFTSESGYAAMHAVLRMEPRPSAVFVANDLMAIGALCAAHECGVAVPDDISLVGFDDIELAHFTCPPLTTVAQPKLRIATMAVDMLLERIEGRRQSPRKVMLQPELRVRASTAPYRGTSR